MRTLTVTISGSGRIPILNCHAPQTKIRVSEYEVNTLKALGWKVEVHEETPEAPKAEAPKDEQKPSSPPAPVKETAPAATPESTPVATEVTSPPAEVAPAVPEAAPVAAEPVAEVPAVVPEAPPAAPKAPAKAAKKGSKSAKAGTLSPAEQVQALEDSAAVVKYAEEHGIDLGFPEGTDPHDDAQLAQYSFEDLKKALLEVVSAPAAQ